MARRLRYGVAFRIRAFADAIEASDLSDVSDDIDERMAANLLRAAADELEVTGRIGGKTIPEFY